MNKIITRLDSGDNEENATIYEVGKHEIIEIVEHRAMGEGDKWYYDIIRNDGHSDRIFNPLHVCFKEV